MALYIGIFLSFCCGFFIINMISTSFSLMEKVGLSFPIGIAVETIAMLIIDQMGVNFSITSLLLIQVIILLGISVPTILKEKKNITRSIRFSAKHSLSGTNFVWLIFMIAIIYIEYMNFYKCIYIPPYDNDSLSSFDTIGFVAAMEHTYKGLSLFDKNYIINVHGPGSTITYAPFVQLSYAYVYTLGAETSKIIPALMYLSFLIAFYGVIKRSTSKTAAAVATFFVIMTPDMTMFSSLSMTNVMHAVFASLGIIYIYLFIKQREKKDLYLSGILLGANMWCRTEGVVFVITAFAIFLIYSIISKKYKSFIIFATLAVLPALFWVIFMKINNLYSENAVITKFFWDIEKIKTILNGISSLFNSVRYYGWTFITFFIIMLLNIWFMIKKKDNLAFLAMILISISCYMLILYHIDYKWDIIDNVLDYSAKRFLYCFVPLVWYYSCTSYVSKFLFSKLDNLLSLHQKSNN